MRKGAFGVVLGAVLALCVAAVGGEYVTLPVSGRSVAFTNSQANSEWDLNGVLLKWAATPSRVGVVRVSGGVSWVLTSAAQVTTNMWWVPEGRVPFRFGDAVVVECPGATGTVQVLYGRGES